MKLPSTHAHVSVNGDLRAYQILHQSANRSFPSSFHLLHAFQSSQFISFCPYSIPATAEQTWFLGFLDCRTFAITIERVFFLLTIHYGKGYGLIGTSARALQTTTRLFVCRLWDSERGYSMVSLFSAGFLGFAELGAVFFTRCIIGVYYRCVYCGKTMSFPFRV